jgi:hypothetical protein
MPSGNLLDYIWSQVNRLWTVEIIRLCPWGRDRYMNVSAVFSLPFSPASPLQPFTDSQATDLMRPPLRIDAGSRPAPCAGTVEPKPGAPSAGQLQPKA